MFNHGALVKKGIFAVLITIMVYFKRQKSQWGTYGLITHLTFQSLQLMSPFVLQMDRPKDCFIKCPVFYQAPLPIPLLEINIMVVWGWTCMFSGPTWTNGSSQVVLWPMGAVPRRQHEQCVDSSSVESASSRILLRGHVYQQATEPHPPSDGPGEADLYLPHCP